MPHTLQIPGVLWGSKPAPQRQGTSIHITNEKKEVNYPNGQFCTYPITFEFNSSQALLKEKVCEKVGWESRPGPRSSPDHSLSLPPVNTQTQGIASLITRDGPTLVSSKCILKSLR
jgi:hypothetical protein